MCCFMVYVVSYTVSVYSCIWLHVFSSHKEEQPAMLIVRRLNYQPINQSLQNLKAAKS